MISASKQNSPFPSKVVSPLTQRSSLIKSFYLAAVRLDRFGFAMLRLGLVVVLCWIAVLRRQITKRKVSCRSWRTVRS